MAYRGSVTRLPVGMLGLSGSRNPTQLQAGHFRKCEGVTLDGGLIQKEGGANKVNTSPLGAPSAVISGISYSPIASAVRDAVMLADGSVLKGTGSGDFSTNLIGGNDTFTKILLHMDGADASTVFTDVNAGGGAHVWTAVGNAQIDTADSVFGGASGLFDGVGDCITTPDSADYVLGGGPFTLSCRFKINGGNGAQLLMAGQIDAGVTAAGSSFLIERHTSNIIRFWISDGATFTFVSGFSTYTTTSNPGWHHLEVDRVGNTISMYVDGAAQAVVGFSGTVPDSAAIMAVGRGGALTGVEWNGWIDEFKLDVGVARHSAVFTPPSSAYSSVLIPTRDPPPYFMMGGGESAGSPRTLFLFSATNQVQYVDGDGAVMAPITTPPADWTGAGNFPTFGVLHEGRLWGGGNASDPHRMYYSQAGAHKVFSAPGGTLSIFPGEGERLVGGLSFKGLLILFKYPKGVYVVDTTDPSPTGWRVTTLSKSVGGVNQHTIVPVDNDTIYMDAGGNIQLLSATNAFGGTETANVSQISEIAQFMRDNVDLTKIRRAVGTWYGVKQQAIFALPKVSGTGDNTIRLGVDYSNPQVGPRFLKSERDTPISLWMRPDSFGVYKPAHGDNAGSVWAMDQMSRDKGGVGYEFSFETADMDLSFIDPKMATLNKTGDFLEIIFEPQGDWDLVVQVVWDDVPGTSILYAMGGSGAPLGSFTLDVDIFAATSIRSIRKRIAGSGRRIRINASNSGLDQNVAISDFYLSFRAMDERVRANA